jgi:hypothetical protein
LSSNFFTAVFFKAFGFFYVIVWLHIHSMQLISIQNYKKRVDINVLLF